MIWKSSGRIKAQIRTGAIESREPVVRFPAFRALLEQISVGKEENRMKKRLVSLALCLGLITPAIAADTSGPDPASAKAFYNALSTYGSQDVYVAYADLKDMDGDKVPEMISFTVIRKYSQQLIINADKQSVQETENKLKNDWPSVKSCVSEIRQSQVWSSENRVE